jgi:ketosteroid isomerase-like protein
MSRQNVEVVRQGFEAWNAGDMEAFRDLYAEDAIIVRFLEGWPESGPFVGRDTIMRTFEQLRQTWDSDTLEIISSIDLGDRVLTRYLWRGVGHGPGLRLEATILYTLRKGRAFLLEYFWDHADALEALGLSEQGAHADS